MKILSLLLLIGCLFSIGQSLTLACAEDHSTIINSSFSAKCVPNSQIIANCLTYNAADETKCSECRGGAVLEGTTPNITACDCTGKPEMARDNEDDKVCVAGIANCSLYKATDLTKCFACHWGAVKTGGANDYSECNCDAKPNVVKDQRGVSHCVASLIPNCEKYHQEDATKCNVCRTGSTPDAAAGSITQCDCTGLDFTDGVDENGVGICATAGIDNCLKYSSVDPNKCHTCIPGAVPDVNSPETTVCACQDPNILSVDEQGNSVCIVEANIIPDCKAYNSEYLHKCLACADGYEPGSGESAPRIDTCVCASGTIAKLDENGDRICVPQAIDNCKFYANSDPSKCHTCITGYVETGGSAGLRDSCECNGGNVEKLDENSENVCVTSAVVDCDIYSSEHANKCHSCLPGFTPVGTSPQITECTCDSSTHTKTVDGDGNAVCVQTNALIDNCIAYNKDDLSQCHTCIQGVTLNGSSPNITECGCASPKQIKPTETDGVNVCVTIIEGCTQYNSSQITQCHACGDDFTKNEGNTECNCTDNTKVYAIDENNLEICGADITNCETWNSGNKDQCYSCETPYSGNGDSNDHTECACSEAGQIAVTDEAGVKHCAAKIEFCDLYLSTDRTQCESCIENSVKSGDSSSCECANRGIDENNKEVCVGSPIENCIKYNSAQLDKCHTCLEGIDTGSDILNDRCYCDTPALKMNGDTFCPYTTHQRCAAYADDRTCGECEGNFQVVDGGCQCDNEKIKYTADGTQLCLLKVIEFCELYENDGKCAECYASYFVTPEKDVCTDNPELIDNTGNGNPSGGNLVSFGLVVLALLVAVSFV